MQAAHVRGFIVGAVVAALMAVGIVQVTGDDGGTHCRETTLNGTKYVDCD